MSWRATSWASDQVTGSPITKSVLWKLADNANDEGVCWPSLDTIAQHTELSRRTVQDHLARLERLGLIEIEKREAESGASLSNKYRLAMPPPVSRPARGEGAGAATRGAAGAGGGAAGAGGDAAGRTPGVQLRAPHKEPTNEPSENRHSLSPVGARESVGGFHGEEGSDHWPEMRSAIAQTWPGGFPADDEVVARAVFVRLVQRHRVDLLIACARAHGSEKSKQQDQRKAHQGALLMKRPSNWLREGRWEGYVPSVEEGEVRERATTLAMGRVQAAVGNGLMEIFRRVGLSDAEIASLDGLAVDPGPPEVWAVSGFQKLLLERRIHKLERELGREVVLVNGGARRRA